MKTKIEIKNRWTGSILFEFETENNSVRKTLEEGRKKGADLQGADLQGADLQGAYLQGAYLRGADLQGAYLQGAYLQGAYLQGADLQGADLQGADDKKEKIKKACVFTGLYDYVVIPYITEGGEKRVKMGCHDRSLQEWKKDFWNNPSEFPNNNSEKSNMRVFAFETAEKWFKIVTKK